MIFKLFHTYIYLVVTYYCKLFIVCRIIFIMGIEVIEYVGIDTTPYYSQKQINCMLCELAERIKQTFGNVEEILHLNFYGLRTEIDENGRTNVIPVFALRDYRKNRRVIFSSFDELRGKFEELL